MEEKDKHKIVIEITPGWERHIHYMKAIIENVLPGIGAVYFLIPATKEKDETS